MKRGLTVNNNELTEKFHAIRNGDKAAFAELYQDMRVPIFTIISRITWDESVSEDVLQDVLVKLFLSPPEPSIKNPRAYIFQMAHNMAINNTKKQPQHISLDELSEAEHRLPDDFPLHMDIDDALKSLPSQECQIVILHVVGELKFREISEIMNIPLGTALWKYQKAIGKLQKIIAGGPL
jgi:RNA polymerase sigma-70 factor (ECF subfamily)